MSLLNWNRYGKSRIRLVRVRRPGSADPPAPHHIVDLTLDVQLEGAFDPVYVAGDNRGCLATDTMKNTVYALARHDAIEQTEPFAQRLAAHFVSRPLVARARISVVEQRWERMLVRGKPHPHAFVQPGGEQWTACVTDDANGPRVTGGLTNLVVLKTTESAFSGFPRDEFTTLPDTADRILATSITATWSYRPGADGHDVRPFDYSSARQAIRQALVDTFAVHDSRSVQHTLYAMGEAALAACGAIDEITLTMPNRHHLLVDLAAFGLDNPNVVFVATDQPFGLIEATIRR